VKQDIMEQNMIKRNMTKRNIMERSIIEVNLMKQNVINGTLMKQNRVGGDLIKQDMIEKNLMKQDIIEQTKEDRAIRLNPTLIVDKIIKSKTRLIFPYWGREKQIRHQLKHSFAVKDPEFLRGMGHLLGPSILYGNKVKALHNGDQIFSAMLRAIRKSKKTITFETHVYSAGDIGRKFSKALCERSRAGVKVHVILDWYGSDKIDKKYVEDMKAAGIELEKYHPPRWYNLNRMNNRTHRKLLIIDGKIGFIGGVGIADEWQGNAESKNNWRDSHYQVEGPVVAQMQAAFNNNWIKTHSQVLLGNDYFPELKPIKGGVLAQAFKSSNNGSENVRLMNLLSISSAVKNIRLQAAYFVPDELAIETFVSARKRGVNIEIIVPGPFMNEKTLQKVSRSLWGVLLDAGVKIYEYQPTMYHCKVLIVDDLWVSIGSTNFDDRSFQLNDEANLNIYDSNFAAKQIKVFEEDKSKSRLMTLEIFRDRYTISKIIDKLTRVLRREM
jgi:cardiolipin synthase